MGRVARYKKVKKSGFRDDSDKDRDRPPSRKKMKKESLSQREFREMMEMASKKKRDKKKKKRKRKRGDELETKAETETQEDTQQNNNETERKIKTTSSETKRRSGESIGQYNRRMRDLNNQIIIRNTKALQKTRAKRKKYLNAKKEKKKLKNRRLRADSDDDYRKADVIPFGATNDTVPTISVVPKAILPKGQRKVKLPKPLSPALQRERARVMKAYQELLERRKRGLA
jgi:hypothetical protein